VDKRISTADAGIEKLVDGATSSWAASACAASGKSDRGLSPQGNEDLTIVSNKRV